MNPRNWFQSYLASGTITHFGRKATKRKARNRLAFEAMEDRTVPTAISVADIAVREGPTNLGVLNPAGATALVLHSPRGITFDNIPGSAHYHDLFVTSFASVGGQVLRFDWASQTYQSFVTPTSGGLPETAGIAFGPDGNLYVSSGNGSSIYQYDGATGNFLSLFVPAGTGGLNWAGGIKFGSDGDLYVISLNASQILKYEGPTSPDGVQPGQFLSVFATTQHTGPSYFDFGPDGNLYVSCGQLVSSGLPAGLDIDRYYGPSSPLAGQFIGTFVGNESGGLSNSRSPMFDSQGNLYVCDLNLNEVLEFQGPNGANPGAYIQAYLTTGQSNLSSPIGLAIGPDGNLYVSSRDAAQVLRFAPSSQATFTVTLNSANASPVSVNYATADDTAVAGTDYTQTSGTLNFPAGVTSEVVNVPITTVATGGPTKTFTMNLSGALGATISRGQATGSILNRMTKFFVADGGTPKTFEYGSGGTSEEITPEASGNTASRGLATTSAGTIVWVVDANKNVYVYDNHGVLLGSWSAGSLSSSAQLTGIATNGTDIWLVDNQQHKVFKYAGAASRRSGSQSATSSFNLSSGNSNPKDIVTDGMSLWVVNDSSTDKVYRYNLAGSLLGSWTIDPADSSPTGITLDPSNVRDLWIADNGTHRVYQYSSAANRISGSQTAASSFALSANDTNPQGIADPSGVGGDIINTTTALTASGPNPATAAQALAFNVAVDGGAADGDIVELHDSTYDGAFVASGILNSGIVTITVPPNTLAVGTHALVAVYPGNASKAPSLSSPITQVINSDAATSTALTATPNATTGGTLVTFTAVVSPDPGYLGTVSFLDNGAAIAGGSNIALTDGVATFQIATLVVGSHPITATFSGAIGFAPSTSNAVDFAVTPAATTTILTAVNPGPASIAQSIAFTVTVAGGASTDGETVVIKDASNGDAVVPTIGGPLSGGLETLTIAAGGLSVGQDQLYAVYAGDSFNAGNQSSQVIQTITSESPPQLTGITVNGGTAYGTYAGIQRSMVVSLQLTFDQAATLDPGAFALTVHAANVSGAIPTLTANTPDGGLSWIVTFSGTATDPNTSLPGTAPANGMRSLVDGVYDIAVNSSLVRLASDPSVTGSSTTTQSFYRLFGDISGEEPVVGGVHTATVNTTDNLPFRTAFNTVAGAPGTQYQAYFDFDGDGQVNTTDNLQFRNRFNRPLSWSA